MLTRLQGDIHYHFKQVKLLETALRHTSAANELGDGVEHNERLEFLGDAVLELCISEELYQRFPSVREGVLTAMRSQLVNQQRLAGLSRSIHLNTHISLGKGEENQNGREKDTVLSDAFEALLGAVYLDGGIEAAQAVVRRLFKPLWGELNDQPKAKDYKSVLQELTQDKYKERPLYSLENTSGPEHAKDFFVRMVLPDGTVFEAKGSSVKRAEQNAAAMGIAYLREIATQ